MAGFNPNKKKKTYSFNRSQVSRIIATVVDGKAEYFDQTLAVIDNSIYQIQAELSQGFATVVQYDEDVIEFNSTDFAAATFNVIFKEKPFLTLEVLPAHGFENIGFFASNLSTTGFMANVSAPFSGQIVYRALYAKNFPQNTEAFPVIIERVVVSSSYYYTASAGTLPNNSNDTFIASYSQLSASTYPTNIFFTPIDDDNNHDAGIVTIETGSIGLTSTAVTFSAPVYNSIHYLAVKS